MSTATMQIRDQRSQAEAAIRTLLEGVRKAHLTKSAAAIASAYTPDAEVFNLAPPLSHLGVDVTEKQEWLNSWEGPIQIEAQGLKVSVSGDQAFCHGFCRLTGTKKASEQVDFWMRQTICLLLDGGEWRIVHEQASVPFYMDCGVRPAFDLRP